MPAPFDGVLVPEPQYRFYQDMAKECAFKDIHPRPCEPEPEFLKELPWAIAGIIVGFIGGVIAK